LFVKVWLLALTPVNIITGLKKCGVYPYDAIAVPDMNGCNGAEQSSPVTEEVPPVTDQSSVPELGNSTTCNV